MPDCATLCHLSPVCVSLCHLEPPCATFYPLVLPCISLYNLLPPCTTLYHLVLPCTTLYQLEPPSATLCHLVPRCHRFFQSYFIFLVIFEKYDYLFAKIVILNMTIFWKMSPYDYLQYDYYLRNIETWRFAIWVVFLVRRNVTKMQFYARRIVFTISFF